MKILFRKIIMILIICNISCSDEFQEEVVVSSAKPSNHKYLFSWKNQGTPHNSFLIERSVNNGPWQEIESTYSMPKPFTNYKFAGINRNFYYIDNGLQSGNDYQYRVNGKLVKTVSLTGQTYYVRNGGNDAADGLTDETAWATIERANSNRKPGDLILFKRGEVFTAKGPVFLENQGNGTQDNPIRWSAYGKGDRPIIELNYKWGLYLKDVSNWTFDHLNFKGTKNVTHCMIFIHCENKDMNGIKILSCDVDCSSIVGGSYGGIFLWNEGENHAQKHHINNIEIAYTRIFGTKLHSAIRSHDVQSNAHYHNNYLFNNDGGITVSGGLNHCVEYNEIRGGTYSKQIRSGTKANSQAYYLENMVFRHNLIYYCDNYGLSLQGSNNGLVEYNTVYSNTAFGAFFLTAENKPENVSGNIIRNNIFVGSAHNHGAVRIELKWLGSDWRNKFDWDYNLIYESNGSIIKFIEPTYSIESHEDWQEGWQPYHPNDIHADPLFYDITKGDFKLKSNSPAKGMGYSAGTN